MNQLDGAAISRDPMGLYPGSLASSLQSCVNTDSQEQIRLARVANALGNIEGERSFFILELLQVHGFKTPRINYSQAACIAHRLLHLPSSRLRIAHFVVVQLEVLLTLCLLIYLRFDSIPLGRGITVVVLFEHDDVVC